MNFKEGWKLRANSNKANLIQYPFATFFSNFASGQGVTSAVCGLRCTSLRGGATYVLTWCGRHARGLLLTGHE